MIPPKKFAIFYAFPISINGVWNVNDAVNEFNSYHMVVFGKDLSTPSHPEYNSTLFIISNTTSEIYGEIDCTLPISKIKKNIKNWKVMNAAGVLCNGFGFDFGMTRNKQNEIIDYIHQQGLIAILNAWNLDDIFTGSPTINLLNNDWILLESYQIKNGNYQDETEWNDKNNKIINYKNNGFNFNVVTITTNDSNNMFDQNKWDYAYYSTALYSYQACGYGEYLYSAVSALLPFRERKEFIGTNTIGNVQVENNKYKINTNVGVYIDAVNHLVNYLIY